MRAAAPELKDTAGSADGEATGKAALPTRIRVVVRVRPKLAIEASHSTKILRVLADKSVIECGASVGSRSFRFDHVFDGATPQRSFYDQLGVDRMLKAVLDGYHATIFAYGQTGSGKTFTMEGYDYERSRDASLSGSAPQARFDASTGSDRVGLIPRAISTLFELIARVSRDTSREFVVKCSFLQIYNEQILDLFNPSHFLQPRKLSKPGGGGVAAAKAGGVQGLRLRWSAVRDFYVENLRFLECTSPDHVLQHFQDGIKHKIMASHNLNAASSRSHCVFTLYVESFDPVNNPSDVLQSKLALVDLAGSERVDKTGATGVTLQESIGINKSLFVLRQVIQALSEEAQAPTPSYIPYRDSKLTSLLKYALGGNSWTLMIACLSPSDAYVDENMSTLLYAAKAQAIANHPTKNEDPKTVLINELKAEVQSLRRQLASAQEVILQFQSQQVSETEGVTATEVPSATSSKPFREPEGNRLGSNVHEMIDAAPVVVAKETKSTTTLKRSVIDNVEMIKQLYATEKQLNEHVKRQEEKLTALQHETRVLQVENRSLREKMEVLEYLLATQTTGEEPGEPEQVEIPGYGSSQSTGSLSLTPPDDDKLQEVVANNRTPSRRVKAGRTLPPRQPQPPPSNQDPSHFQPTTTKDPTKPAKRRDSETGLLSLSELRDLLNGKRMAATTEGTAGHVPPQRGSRQRPRPVASRPSTNPSPMTPLVHPIPDEDPTAAILNLLHREKAETGTSTLEKDPIESLSELNRLLRVKATLRRSSSFK